VLIIVTSEFHLNLYILEFGVHIWSAKVMQFPALASGSNLMSLQNGDQLVAEEDSDHDPYMSPNLSRTTRGGTGDLTPRGAGVLSLLILFCPAIARLRHLKVVFF
jgi:hypothetical protein